MIKSEIRILGVDDGKFVPHTHGAAIVVGVVFRGGCLIDGVMHTYVAIDGFDATEKLASMINSSPHSKQLRLVMLNGLTFAGFNVVDIKRLNLATKLPIIAVTRHKPDLEAVRKALNNLPQSEERWRTILAAGDIHEVSCLGKRIYLELTGISLADAQKIVELTSTNSRFPEPLRVAHLIASGITP
ncbi:MAG TPA: DUF99 family protein [Candidatus Limnocylindrales bacterium]|nr:DUF99 family protein [Candidatus Limnocylindrales bacterium]